LSGTIVLKIPYESKSFHAARAALQEPLPVETYEARQEILSRIQEWTGVTIALEDAAYIPLRTDWMPPRDRRTADGVAVLLAGRWPAEVQAAIAAGQFAWVSGRIVAEFWKCIAACGLSRDADQEQCPAAAPAETTAERTDLNEDGPSEAPEEAPVVIHIQATPVNHVDGWSWSHVVTEIRRWADIYPDPLPDPNDISEAGGPGAPEDHLSAPGSHRGVLSGSGWSRRRLRGSIETPGRSSTRSTSALICPTQPRRRWRRSSRALMTATGTASWRSIGTRSGIARRSTHGTSGTALIGSATRPGRMLALAKRVARTIHIEASMASDDRRGEGRKVGPHVRDALADEGDDRLRCPAVAVTPDEFDARPELLNCRNGTLELDTLTFREARREDLLTKCCGVDYDPAASARPGSRTSILVFGGDAAYIRGFQELCGYSLLQYTRSRSWRSSTARKEW